MHSLSVQCNPSCIYAAKAVVMIYDAFNLLVHSQELQRRGPAGRGIVLDAVLIGAPVSGSALEWCPLLEEGVVGGRLVNAYSKYTTLLKIILEYYKFNFD